SSRLVTLPWRTGSGFRVERGGRAARRGAWSSCAYYACPAAHGGDKGDAQGRLAQWVERLLYTQDVGGSSPSPPTILRACGAWAGKPSHNCANGAQRYRWSKRTSIGRPWGWPPTGLQRDRPQRSGLPSHRFLEFLGRAEGDLLAGLDLDRFAGRGIASHAGCALAHHQDAEAADPNAVPLLEVFGHQVHQ